MIRDGPSSPEDIDAPYVYRGSHVLPEPGDPQGGSVDLAYVAAHVRFWRDHPGADAAGEPERGCEPFLRLGVSEHPSTPNRSVGDATVLLSADQVRRLAGALAGWLESVEANAQVEV